VADGGYSPASVTHGGVGRALGWGLLVLVLVLVVYGLQTSLSPAVVAPPTASSADRGAHDAATALPTSDDNDGDRVGSRWLSSVARSGAALAESGAVGFASTPTPASAERHP
jgi:hypothetical protein